MTPSVGIAPRPHNIWWGTSALTTAPSLISFLSSLTTEICQKIGGQIHQWSRNQLKASRKYSLTTFKCIGAAGHRL